MIGTFFLEILPEVVKGEQYLNHFVYMVFLGGFVLIHVLEKYIYQHMASQRESFKHIHWIEVAGVAAYEGLLGVLIVVFYETYDNLIYLVLIPFFVRELALSLTTLHMCEQIQSRFNRFIQPVSPVIGVIVGLLLIQNKTQLYMVFAIVIGIVLYIIVRDIIPQREKGNPVYFVIGVILTLITIQVVQGF